MIGYATQTGGHLLPCQYRQTGAGRREPGVPGSQEPAIR